MWMTGFETLVCLSLTVVKSLVHDCVVVTVRALQYPFSTGGFSCFVSVEDLGTILCYYVCLLVFDGSSPFCSQQSLTLSSAVPVVLALLSMSASR